MRLLFIVQHPRATFAPLEWSNVEHFHIRPFVMVECGKLPHSPSVYWSNLALVLSYIIQMRQIHKMPLWITTISCNTIQRLNPSLFDSDVHRKCINNLPLGRCWRIHKSLAHQHILLFENS